ncbi:DEAD/DEAH box helicase [Puniceibacterium confluentis]|uniref:DEAD/DEAH box helicase n=1 Tax=Puniceibacterium confluentis TaxID=1958944 RepID=UPI0011B85684|nr:DEAD/DEAH box helicase [Puniceibacterium confluentis]
MIQTLADALAEKGFTTLTPVQEAVTDPALAGRDLLVSAQTGSGKTVGFGLAIADTLLDGAEKMGRAGSPLALIVAPTRELAFQVMREITWLYARTGAVVATCVGGMDMRAEKRTLERGAHIVVGTPGRLVDHIKRGSLDMSGLRAVVLDEADEMLDLGFREDLEFMLGEAPVERRTLMFSATVPAMIATLAKQYQNNAERVNTTTGATQHADISYQAMAVAQHDAEHAVINLLLFHDAENAIVFANTRAMVARLTARLSNRGFAVVSLSGELSQTERTHALQAMRDGRAKVCVATDVAARGIDLPNLDLVIHAELPSNSETLLHRSGRTGRAGRKGVSALIVPQKVRGKAMRLLKFAKLNAEWTVPPSADDIVARDEDRLLNDPNWTQTATESEAGFAAKLTERYSAEQIATAFLRLHQARRSAPEDLSAPDTKAERKPREFGPSVWFRLSAGRDQNAEPRWLLPLLCRAGNIDKDSLGAIRVQETESFVELLASDADRFLAAIGPDGALEDGMTIHKLDKAPDIGAPPRRDSKPRSPRPDARPRSEYKPKRDAAPRAEEAPRPAARPAGEDAPVTPPAFDDTSEAPVRPRAPAKKPYAPRADAADRPRATPYKPREDRGDAPGKPKPYKPHRDDDDRPRAKPYKGRDDSADGGKGPYKGKPGGKFAKPGGKPAGKFGKPGDKPYGKSADGGGKPAGKFGKPAGKPYGDAKPKPAPAKAGDTSKRFTPPGAKGKPRGPKTGKPAGRPGGNDVPRRGKD